MLIRGKNMECKNVLGVSLLGLTCLVGAQTANAEIALQPQAVPFGSFDLIPTLTAKTVFDDNIYSLNSNEVSSLSQIINPNLSFVAKDRANVYKLMYNLNAAGYTNDSNDSYNDHKLDLSAHIEPSARLRYDAGLAYGMLHDDRGQGASSGFGLGQIRAIGEVDKYDLTTLRAGVEYGAKTARGLLVANADLNQKRYSRDSSAKSRDNDTLNMLLGLRARVMPKTTFLVDYELVDTQYENAPSQGGTADSKDTRTLLGVSWENTIQTTGKLRIGKQKREVVGASSIDKTTWDLGAQLKPTPLDSFNIDASLRVSDATAPFSSTESTSYSISWAHNWMERLSTKLNASQSKSDYVFAPGKTGIPRSDDSNTYGVNVSYQMRRWLVLGADVSASDKSSTDKTFANKRNIMSISAQVSL